MYRQIAKAAFVCRSKLPCLKRKLSATDFGYVRTGIERCRTCKEMTWDAIEDLKSFSFPMPMKLVQNCKSLCRMSQSMWRFCKYGPEPLHMKTETEPKASTADASADEASKAG